MAGYEWDPAQEVLREREIEHELMLASHRTAPHPLPDLSWPQDVLSPVTQLPALESTHIPDTDLPRSDQPTTSSTFPAQVAGAEIPAAAVRRRLRQKVPPPCFRGPRPTEALANKSSAAACLRCPCPK